MSDLQNDLEHHIKRKSEHLKEERESLIEFKESIKNLSTESKGAVKDEIFMNITEIEEELARFKKKNEKMEELLDLAQEEVIVLKQEKIAEIKKEKKLFVRLLDEHKIFAEMLVNFDLATRCLLDQVVGNKTSKICKDQIQQLKQDTIDIFDQSRVNCA